MRESMAFSNDPATPMSRTSTARQEQVMTSGRSSSRAALRGRAKSPTTSAKNEEPSALPNADTLFRTIYQEFDKLRNCGMSRRDFFHLVDKKENKSLSVKTIAFWEGVLAGLKLGAQLPTFANLPYYQ